MSWSVFRIGVQDGGGAQRIIRDEYDTELSGRATRAIAQ